MEAKRADGRGIRPAAWHTREEAPVVELAAASPRSKGKRVATTETTEAGRTFTGDVAGKRERGDVGLIESAQRRPRPDRPSERHHRSCRAQRRCYMAGKGGGRGWGISMLTLPSSVRVFVAATPTDLRKSFDGLSIAVTSRFGKDPLCGDLYVFFNKRRTQVRILFWDRTGYCIVGKKLARGTFHFVHRDDGITSSVEMDAAELGLILEGIDVTGAKRFLRWRPTTKAA